MYALYTRHFICKVPIEPHNNPRGQVLLYADFTDDETEAQKGQVTYPRPHSLQVATLGFESKQSDATICTMCHSVKTYASLFILTVTPCTDGKTKVLSR